MKKFRFLLVTVLSSIVLFLIFPVLGPVAYSSTILFLFLGYFVLGFGIFWFVGLGVKEKIVAGVVSIFGMFVISFIFGSVTPNLSKYAWEIMGTNYESIVRTDQISLCLFYNIIFGLPSYVFGAVVAALGRKVRGDGESE